MHIGLKGTKSALYLVDLAAKTRRGLRGRVEAGASAGGLTYGYDIVQAAEGADRGARAINAHEASIVVRILTDYAISGLSPRRIAADLNHTGVPGPRGGPWSQSTINGNRARGTGILNNELYRGCLVWNRLSYVRDPDTGKRRSRLNPEGKWVLAAVPHLRIAEEMLWEAVKRRQVELDARAVPAADGSSFQSQQRPKYLLSGLVRCGTCGGGMSVISATHLGCSNSRNKGTAVCVNLRTIKRATVEAQVVDALRTRLMAADVYAAFVRGFTTEWNREQATRSGEQEAQRAELQKLKRKIDKLVAAIADIGVSPALQNGLREAEARQAELVGALAVTEAPAPRLIPNLAHVYYASVARLQDALSGDDAAAAREHIRALIEEVRVIPCFTDPKAAPTLEVRGHLAAMLALGSGQDASAALLLKQQIKLVAGARNRRQTQCSILDFSLAIDSKSKSVL